MNEKTKNSSKNNKNFWIFSWIWLFIYARNGTKIHTFVSNYISYMFTNQEHQNYFVIITFLQRNERKDLKQLWNKQKLLNFFLNLSIHLCTKWYQSTHICSKLYLLYVYKLGTSKLFRYNFVFAEKWTKRHKTALKTTKTFEFFIEFEYSFMHDMVPRYTHLVQIISTIR